MSGLQLDANITSVTFKPRGFVTIEGMVWSKLRDSRVVNGTANRYSQSWFWWDSTMPIPVSEVLMEASRLSTIALVSKNALPSLWPEGLVDGEQEQHPFNINIDQFRIVNPNWDKDTLNQATFSISSSAHFIGDIRESIVTYDIGDIEFEEQMFEVLENYL